MSISVNHSPSIWPTTATSPTPSAKAFTLDLSNRNRTSSSRSSSSHSPWPYPSKHYQSWPSNLSSTASSILSLRVCGPLSTTRPCTTQLIKFLYVILGFPFLILFIKLHMYLLGIIQLELQLPKLLLKILYLSTVLQYTLLGSLVVISYILCFTFNLSMTHSYRLNLIMMMNCSLF